MLTRALRARTAAIVVALGSLAAPLVAHAEADAASRATARKIGNEAIKLYDAGQFAAALDKFNTADALVPAPTLGLHAARCLAKLGRLVEASERYLDVTRMQLDRSAPLVMRKAQAEALTEREALLPKIPSLEIAIEGPTGDGISITVNGKPLASALVGQRRPIDPGAHHVEIKRADTTVSRDVTLNLGQIDRLLIKLPPLPPKPVPKTPPLRWVGWSAIGLGAFGAVFGAVNGVLAIVTQQSLLDKCPDRRCPEFAWPQAKAYDLMRVFTTTGVVIGVVGLGAGIPIVLVTPKTVYEIPPADAGAKAARAPQIDVWINAGGAGLSGVF